jgi:hypothetical protein
MGVGPLISPEKERQMREAAYHASLAPPPPPYHHAEEEGDTMEGDQPQTLKEYYEQKRKMRERSMRLGGGKLEVGADGLLMSKEKKPPLRIGQNKSSPSTATNIDWSGY